MLTAGRQISGGPMSDVKLTEANALDGELPEDQLLDAHKPAKDKLAEAVAGALVKGLEDSIEGKWLVGDDVTYLLWLFFSGIDCLPYPCEAISVYYNVVLLCWVNHLELLWLLYNSVLICNDQFVMAIFRLSDRSRWSRGQHSAMSSGSWGNVQRGIAEWRCDII